MRPIRTALLVAAMVVALGAVAVATGGIVAALGPAAALAQSNPFNVRGPANPPAGPVIAAEAPAPPSPLLPPPERPSMQSFAAEPPVRPFDVNGDGWTPALETPTGTSAGFRPSTTLSPLVDGSAPAAIVPVDATSEEQRRDLNRVLRDDVGSVRELRVDTETGEPWADAVVDRPIVPFRSLRLDGEIASRSWPVFLSAAEAARGGTLSIGFTNSVLVLPEASRLRIFLNGRQIAETAIDSPDRTKLVALPVSSDLLRAGENAIRLEAEMRHRIDCSINATFELWTRIDMRLTGFTFAGGRIPLTNLNDLPAIGVGPTGATRLRVAQRAPALSGQVDRMLRAVQAAALRGRFVQPVVEVMGEGAAPAPGTLNIAIGVYDEVRELSSAVPTAGASAPLTALIDPPDLGPTIVITGPTERAVELALAQFDVLEDSAGRKPGASATPPWLAPGAVRINGPRSVTLRAAGVETQNFSGRRFSTGFKIILPPDFYAAAYGEARLLVDAAYVSDVRAGSRLAVVVNGILTTSVSFTSSTGEVLDDVPIVLAMTNFRPGINRIEIVAELNTDADATCLPGGTVPARDRFALFSSTRLVFPQFARIGQLPNLASFAANGFPYQLTSAPLRLNLGGSAPETIGAAGTLVARMAVSRGASFEPAVVEDVAPFAAEGVIVVAPLASVPDPVLELTGVASVVPSTWVSPRLSPAGAGPDGLERYDDVLRRLRQQLRQEEDEVDELIADASDTTTTAVAANRVADPRGDAARTREEWFEEINGEGTFGRFFGGIAASVRDAVAFDVDLGRSNGGLVPPLIAPGTSLILAQAVAPRSDETAWTLVTAPTPALLAAAMAAVASPDVWTRIGGRLTAYELDGNNIQVIPAEDVVYVTTVPLTFGNLRLIAANWFSINSGVYAIVLVLVAALLGLVTWLLVTPIGRRS